MQAGGVCINCVIGVQLMLRVGSRGSSLIVEMNIIFVGSPSAVPGCRGFLGCLWGGGLRSPARTDHGVPGAGWVGFPNKSPPKHTLFSSLATTNSKPTEQQYSMPVLAITADI